MRYDLDLENHSLPKRLIVKVLIYLVEAAIVVFVAYAITHYGLETMVVSGEYMSPTLKDSDTILINRMSYKIHQPRRNDVIVTQENGSEHSYFTINRVIGLPGETVLIQEGQVYINGKPLKEKLDFPLMENGGMALDTITLEQDEFFVLGDNRNECEDSRNANVGNIHKEDIVGKAWMRLNAFTFIGMINNFGKREAGSDNVK